MYKFGTKSQQKIATCHPDLQDILDEAIKIVDFTVLCGHRGEEEQNEYFHSGRSKVQYPNSKHNQMPSVAVDIAPYPIDWNNIERFAQLGGIIKGIAHTKGVKIRCGFDWDCDGDITDHSFMDWPHIELVL
ncbi:M15 family peptidase [Candidatus Bathyarchaeota archaeon]|nr:MAG: M15 family peptidase [Candidatus Bathyarchaeota archaeon]